MAEFNFSDLMPEVAPHAAGVTEQAVIRCARAAARYFCERTGFLKIETSPLLNIVAGTHTYTITADALSRPIVRALEVWVGADPATARQIHHRSADQLTREYSLSREYITGNYISGGVVVVPNTTPWQLETEYPPRYYFQDMPTTIRLVGIPSSSEAAALKIVSCVKPAITHTSVDEVIINNWYETIVKGVLANLWLEPQKSYSKPQLGVKAEEEFKSLVEDAVGEAVSGFADNDHVVGHVRAYP